MRRSLALLLAVPLLLLALWLALGRSKPVPGSEAAPEPAAVERPAPAAQIESAPAPPDAGRVEAAAAAERAQVAAPEHKQAEVKLAELRGRLLLENGAPASGAGLTLGGAVGNSERLMKYGKPSDWKELSTQADADGRFVLRFDPPRAYQFFLGASYPGTVKAKWRWGEIEPATAKDLGDTVLPRGGAIAGRVLDAQGNPTHDTWGVSADARAISSGDGSDSSRAMAQADPATGQYRIEDLPPGSVQLSAYSQLANRVDGPKVEVRAGETVEADIRYTGPDNSRRIVVSTSTRPFFPFAHEVAEVVLSAPGQEPRKATKQPRSASSYSFDDLAPGSYSVAIDDPRFKPWRQDGVQLGQRVSAQLVGAASVSLAVLDGATRAPLAHYALRARFENVNFRPNEFEVFGKDTQPPAGGLVEGLIPAEQTLLVLAEGYAPCELPLGLLKAGELRPVTAELRKGATLVAHLLQADGITPIAGTKVTLEPSAPEGQKPSNIIYLDAPKLGETQSAADGRASFPAVAAGSYTLRAEISQLLAAELKDCVVALEDTHKDFDLLLPPNGWIAGRVLGLDPAAAATCFLVLLPAELTEMERSLLRSRVQFGGKRQPFLLAADGTFRIGPLRAGKTIASLQFPDVRVEEGPNSSWTQAGAELALGEVEIPAGGEVQREFDLRGQLPGRLEADVSVNGAPAANARVSVRSADPAVQREGVITLDANGHGTSAAIVSGAVRFDISGPDGSWGWTPPGSWTIQSGQTLRVQLDVALTAGALQLVDEASGLPIAEKEVALSAEADADGYASWVQRTTDKQGKLELRLVPARYRLQFSFERSADGRPTPSPYQPTRFDWTASGAVQALLKIAKKP